MAFFQPWLRALDQPAALRLRLHLDDVHAHDLDLEQLLDRLADLRLVRVGVDAERVLAVGRAGVALLGHDRREDDLARVHQAAPIARSRLTSGSAASRDEQRARPDDGAHLELGRRDDRDALEVAERLGGVRLVVVQDEHDRRGEARGLEEAPAPSSSTAPRTAARRPARASPPATWLASAERSAAFAALRLTFWMNVRGTFAKAWPPPSNCGARIVPWRARPVPFWRHGFGAAAGDEAAALRRERAGAVRVRARRARPRGRGAA